jgi:3-oxoadipate enol-lactonase
LNQVPTTLTDDEVLQLGLSAVAVDVDIVPRWFASAACEQQPDLVEGWRVIMGRGDNRSYALVCEMLGHADFREKFDETGVTLQLIGGSEDVATPPETLRVLAKCSGAPEPVILDHIGHVPSVECPSIFSDLLLKC